MFKRRPDADYRVLPLSEIVRARVAIFGEDKDEDGPSARYVICDLQDGDYVLVDVTAGGWSVPHHGWLA